MIVSILLDSDLTFPIAPEPKPKKNRELKTEILPVEIAHAASPPLAPVVVSKPPAPVPEPVQQVRKDVPSLADRVREITLDIGKKMRAAPVGKAG